MGNGYQMLKIMILEDYGNLRLRDELTVQLVNVMDQSSRH